MADVPSLPQTGERFLPVETGQNRYEHLHRYLLSAKYVQGKDVLDIASGEGYGSAILARSARTVTGVDISPEAVAHGRRTYYNDNLRFLVGDCAAIPMADGSVDVVTSFETIEHHSQHDEMMAEVKRVLRPNGILIISSPNKLVYSDAAGFANQFHLRELYFDEFSDLCRRYFANVAQYGQFMGAASFILPLGERWTSTVSSFGGDARGGQHGLAGPRLPMYFVAVCSDAPPSKMNIESLFIDVDEDLFGELTRPRYRKIVQLDQRASQLALPGPAYSGGSDAVSLRTQLYEAMRSLDAATIQLSELHEELAAMREAYFKVTGHSALAGEVPSLDSDDDLAKAEQRIAIMEAEMRDRDERIVTLQTHLDAEKVAGAEAARAASERSRRVTRYNTSLWRASAAMTESRAVVSLLGQQLEETSAALLEAQAELDRVLNSRSWRVTGLLRKAKASLVATPLPDRSQ